MPAANWGLPSVMSDVVIDISHYEHESQ